MFKNLITHRGIDQSFEHSSPCRESSWGAFEEQSKNDLGLEFDIRMTLDKKFVISHENNLTRLTNGKDLRLISEMHSSDIKNIKMNESDRLSFLEEILILIGNSNTISALHLKGDMQSENFLKILVENLKPFSYLFEKQLILFDIRPEAGRFLKNHFPDINIAASVSHEFDILRFNKYTFNTLLTISELIEYKEIYSWAWLDEWDLKAPNNTNKNLVNAKNITILKDNNLKIAAVSPELHATSPHLLAGESHEYGNNKMLLKKCWNEWDQFNIDALCTDYATSLKLMLSKGTL
jgi:glycerophosphoryl diester phosphodiesterase